MNKSTVLPVFITTTEFCALSRLAKATEETYARRPDSGKLPPFAHAKGTKKRIYRLAVVAAWLDITADDIYVALGFKAAAAPTPAAIPTPPAKNRPGRKSNAERAERAKRVAIAANPTRCPKTVDFIDAAGV